MNVQIDETKLLVTILENVGETPNGDEYEDGSVLSLADFIDYLYKDGDYSYDYVNVSDCYPEIRISVCAWTNPIADEPEEVGYILVRLGAYCVDEAIEYMRE
ncbi:MAG: hypothetical protein J5588_07910 [Bacteroidales bacterium]|nr:hypothetical protein [Bacteroidales bacterium]